MRAGSHTALVTVARSAGVALGRLGGRPGPVHLNVQFEEPLVPEGRWGTPDPAGADPIDEAYTLPWIDHTDAVEALKAKKIAG